MPPQRLLCKEILTELAAQDGLSFEVVTDPDGLQINPETRLVAAVPPDPGMADLAAANPAVQFLAIGFPDVAGSPQSERYRLGW